MEPGIPSTSTEDPKHYSPYVQYGNRRGYSPTNSADEVERGLTPTVG